MNVSTLNSDLEKSRDAVEEHYAELERIYTAVIVQAGREAAHALTQSAQVTPMVAATNEGAPDWQIPPEGLLFSMSVIADRAAKRLARLHRRIVKTVTGEPLARAGISWTVTHPLSQALLDAAGQRTGERLGLGVQDTIRETVTDAYARGLPVRDAAALLSEKLADVAPGQAQMLARTDLNSLANGGSVMAAQMVGVQYKTWLTAEDDRVREEHVEADGQTVPIDQPFDVGGEALDYPGDPAGSDAMVCNCRCSVIYADSSGEGEVEDDVNEGALEIDVPGLEITQADRYFHGTGGGPALTVGNAKWDSKYFITPDRSIAERYADRHADGRVQEVKLDSSVRVFKPSIDPIDYTPERLVSIVEEAESAGFGAVHFGGGIGTVVLDRSMASVVAEVVASAAPLSRVPSRGMAVVRKQAESKFGAAPSRNTVALTTASRIPARGFAAAAAELVTAPAWVSDLAFEGMATSDGRYILPDALTWRDLPLSLGAMFDTPHADVVTAAPVVGRIDQIEKTDDDMDGEKMAAGVRAVRGYGNFDLASSDGANVARMVADETLRGVSIDLAVDEWTYRDPETGDLIDPDEASDADMERAMFGELQYAVVAGTIMAATVCPTPAFADARIALTASGDGRRIVRLWAPIRGAGAGMTASAAGLAPAKPSPDWFATPEAAKPTPLTVTKDGRVFGHMALWDSCHTGYPGQCVPPPRSSSGYTYFHLGEVECADGSRVAAGAITLEALHADTDRPLSNSAVRAHYEHTGVVGAYVRAVDGIHGIWVSGALRANLSEKHARDLMGAKPSGDWRQTRPGGPLEMLGVHAVNEPGYPVPRLVASALLPSGGRAVLEFAEPEATADRVPARQFARVG